MTHKKIPLRLQDPYLEREKNEYENPLPSREFISRILSERPSQAMRFKELVDALDITPDEEFLFYRRIKAMLRDNQVIRKNGRIILIGAYKESRKQDATERKERRSQTSAEPNSEKPKRERDASKISSRNRNENFQRDNEIDGVYANKNLIIEGKVHILPNGSGKVTASVGDLELYLDYRQMMQVFHGDIVRVKQIGFNRQNQPEAVITDILERVNHSIVGRLHIVRDNIYYVIAEDRKVHLDISIPEEFLNGAKEDQVVEVKIIDQPTLYSKPVGKITKIIGTYGDSGIEIEIALRKHELPHEFSDATLDQVKSLEQVSQSKVDKSELKKRVDLRKLPLVTIDGDTSLDFDALERGTSVYFPRRVIPMLPEVLSNGLCSLNPNVERLCMVCEMNVTSKGDINVYKFYPAVMKSHARLTYDEVANYLEHLGNPESDQKDIELSPLVKENINNLYKIFYLLNKKRQHRGALDFDAPELKMNFNDNGKIESISPIVRNDAHRLIEECMLAANVCTAKFIAEHEHTSLFRVHDTPTVERIEKLRTFVAEFGLKLLGKEKPTTKHFAKLVESAQDLANKDLINTVILRTMQQAMYTPENIGHFGLAYESYTHFTSPIRRYPDLLVHRTIKAILEERTYDPNENGWSWDALGEHCSMTERRASEASWNVEAWLKCYYMQDKIAEVFMGTISAVTAFGIFVSLDNLHIEGLIHISELGKDYFTYDPAKHYLLGERTKTIYRLGDRICVKVVRVDLDECKIDFMLHRED